MADEILFYKVRIEGWLKVSPYGLELEEIGREMTHGNAICTKMETVAVLGEAKIRETPELMEEDAFSFFGFET